MGRRQKPPKGKPDRKRPRLSAGKSPKAGGARVRDLEKRLAEALKREAESLDQQKATSEILRIISRSPTNLQPVLDAIATNAALVCDAYDAVVFLREGDRLRTAAHYGPITITLQRSTLSRGSVDEVAILDRQPVHVHDVLATEPPVFPLTAEAARRGGFRTILSVPLLRENEAIGTLSIRRREVQPFTTQQIDLLKTFADQAVIAIENVRLFKETKEALEQQTATSEILRAITHAPTDTRPVFDTIVRNARRLCEADSCSVLTYDGALLHLGAIDNATAAGAEAIRRAYPLPATRTHATGRAILTGCPVHIADVREDPEYDLRGVVGAGLRSVLAVPMLREGQAVGTITLHTWATPRPFTDAQIALLQTFADQAVIAIENVRLFKELQTSNRELTTALEQQTATSEILRVISSSPTDAQPVFDTIVRSSDRLLGGLAGSLALRVGDEVHLVALTPTNPEGDAVLRRLYPMPIGEDGGHAEVVRLCRPLMITDTEAELTGRTREFARIRGFRSRLSVPLIRDGIAIGSLGVTRPTPGAFTDREIALLQTFADQAVIAVENVRLFTELEARNCDLTAASEILQVISRSPTDVQPVLDAVAESAARLCESSDAEIFRRDGDRLLLVAHHGPIPSRTVAVPLVRGTFNGRTILEGRTFHVADLQRETDEFPRGSELARQHGTRAQLSVPLMREGVAIGTISLRRTEARLFTEQQIALVQAFADQAVIAIENVRLFKELQTSNRELTTALDTQTATSDILRVISRSQTDVQPVFDAIVHSAVRLLKAYSVALTRIAGDQIELAALTSTDDAGHAALRGLFPRSLHSKFLHAQAVRDRTALNITDAETDPRSSEAGRASAHLTGRSLAVVPLLRQGEPVGTISVARLEPGGFIDDEIALLKTFADQAVIAIENARLLSELQARTGELTRSVEQLTALRDVGRAVSSSLELETVLNTIVARAVQLAGANSGTIWEYDATAEEFVLRITQNVEDPELLERRTARVRRGEGAVGRLALTGTPVQVPDITTLGAYEGRLREALIAAGTRALLAIPLLHEDRLLGGLVISRRTPGEFPREAVDLLTAFATQSALAIQNAHLFLEIEDKSRQLEAASRHKSEFLANMSHELRTPLNAIIGFSEVLAERMFGDLNEKQEEYLKDIYASGQHLLALINDILDLSKIEAGRMELEVMQFDLPTAIDNALTLVRERAGRRGIRLEREVAATVGEVCADERKVKQVLLNLLSNAIKFTPEGGTIDVRAGENDGMVEVAVADTGVGIAPEDQEAVFEEFRQVGTADKKVEGTGLGLALSRKFIELHGGRIWVTSQLGEGATFTFTIPVRRIE